MSDGSKIEWTDASWTPIRARNLITGKIGWHCEHATTGCEFCYSERINKRLGTGLPFKPGHRKDIELFLDGAMLQAPVRWKRPRMIFVCSMTDLFADFVHDEWIDSVFAVMRESTQHTFQVLTKRSRRMKEYVSKRYWLLPLSNVWLGVSAERQQEADERIPDLMETPAAKRFVSLEPLLGPITLWMEDRDEGAMRGCGIVKSGGVTVGTADFPPEGYDDSYPGIDWVIVGGESGPRARPMVEEWALSLRDQCAQADVPFFFKQWGEHDATCRPVGKKRAGRTLDGAIHDGMPT